MDRELVADLNRQEMIMKTYGEDGTVEISGQDLLEMQHVVDEFDVSTFAGMAARRIAATEHRASGMSWSQARKAAASAKASDEILAVVRGALARGANPEQAIRAAINHNR